MDNGVTKRRRGETLNYARKSFHFITLGINEVTVGLKLICVKICRNESECKDTLSVGNVIVR